MIIGLTGISGAGKSTVAALLSEYGFIHLDCDRIVHQEVYKEQNVLAAIADAFGADAVCHDGINRSVLRSRTMGDPTALARLNQTVMPYVYKAIQKHLDLHKKEDVVLDAPLLFEYDLHLKCAHTISVLCDRAVAKERMILRDGITKQDAEKRLNSQQSDSFYKTRSDFVIFNDQNPASLKESVERIIDQIRR